MGGMKESGAMRYVAWGTADVHIFDFEEVWAVLKMEVEKVVGELRCVLWKRGGGL